MEMVYCTHCTSFLPYSEFWQHSGCNRFCFTDPSYFLSYCYHQSRPKHWGSNS